MLLPVFCPIPCHTMTQIKNGSASVATEYRPPISPIQRILIAHLNLYEACHDGKSLGEDASLEEISEEILFYHRGNPIGTNGGEGEEWNHTTASSQGYCSEEAVNFLGLCKALYALPSSLTISEQDDNTNEERTNFIYFGNSILVFVPLEVTPDVVAIIQVSRLYENGRKSEKGSGNPAAMSASIEQTHRLFSILHGGGILHRLDESRSSGRATNNESPYPTMQKLFGLLKEIRKTKNILSRNGGSMQLESAQEAIQRIAQLEEEVKSLRKTLPIRSIRRDLELHYNEYLSYFLEVCIRNGGAGRCLVELMPVPIAQDSGSHIFQVPPSNIQDQQLQSIQESVLKILQSYPDGDDNNASLLGIAVFEQSRLLQSFSNSVKVDLSNNTMSLLMAYMASYRTKMSYVAMSMDGRTPSSLPEAQPGLLKRLLGPMVDKTANQTSMPRKWGETEGRGRFLPSPPPFMMGPSDQLFSLSYDENRQNVWAPRVHLPIPHGSEWKIDDRLVSHMIVFEFLEFSFLVFINHPSFKDTCSLSELSETTLLLMDLEEKLSHAITNAFESEFRALSESISADVTSEPGQDILLVEQSKEKIVLLMDPNLKSTRGSKQNRTDHCSSRDKGHTRHLMGFGPKKKESFSESQSTSHRSTRVEWSTLGLDCRHLFVSRLPLDICLAFDDMINEVRNVKRTGTPSVPAQDENKDSEHSAILELCNSMPCGWIYALATKEKEMYVFFDSSIYVTVADVQSAVQRIKERYIAAI